MRILSASYWDHFVCYTPDNKKIRNGILFENLVEKLLKIIYGVKWTRTKKTHDGSKDFYLSDTGSMQWAECKNYNKDISLEVIAPTLVMAEISEVNKILFFSYSNINRPAQKKIFLFGAKTKKEVEIYSGNTLDELILKNKSKLPKSLQPQAEQINAADYEIEPEYQFQFIQTPVEGSVQNDKYAINIDCVKKINYICINHTLSDDYQIELQFDSQIGINNKDYRLIEKENLKSVNFCESLPVAGGIVKKYYFKPMVFQPELILPIFRVTIKKGRKILCSHTSSAITVKNVWIGETILIGTYYRDLIKDTEYRILNNDILSCLAIYGSSGTGKTRILKESLEILLKNGYRIISFIGNENDSAQVILKEIIYFLYEVPGDEILMEMEKDEIIQETFEQNLAANATYLIAKQFGKATSEEDLMTMIDEKADLLFEKLSRERIAIVIDNVQYFGNALSHFIIKYLLYGKHQARKNLSVLLLTFNTGFITDNSEKLLSYIQDLSKDYPTIKSCEVTGFKEKENGILFLREMLHLKDDCLDNELEMILRKTSLNPYCINQAVLFLYEKGAISHTENTKGYIVSMSRFHDAVKHMPEHLSDIIRERWEDFLNNHNAIKESILTIISVVYLFREVDPYVFDLLKLSHEATKLMTDRMILSRSEDGNYRFHHDMIETFLTNRYPALEKDAFKQIQKHQACRKLGEYSFVHDYYKLSRGNLNYSTLETIHENHFKNNIPLKLGLKYYTRFFESGFSQRRAIFNEKSMDELYFGYL